MVSRDARIGFLLGALTGAGVALVWASKPERLEPVLDRVRTTAGVAETRIREMDRWVDEMTGLARDQAHAIKDVAASTTQRFDEVTEVVQKDLVQSIRELASFFRDIKSALDQRFPGRAA